MKQKKKSVNESLITYITNKKQIIKGMLKAFSPFELFWVYCDEL